MAHIGDLKPDRRNARRHTPRNLAQIAESIQRDGLGRSLLLANDGTILAGNATTEAAGQVGLEDVLVVETDGTKVVAVKRTDVAPGSPAARRLAIADNRAAELAEWDPAVLADLAEEVDLSQFFFDDELDAILSATIEPTAGLTDPDAVPEPPAEPTTRPGDLWQLGRHRLLCGDSTVVADVERLMGVELADVCFTSPPYAEQRDYGGGLLPWEQLMRDVFSILPVSDDAQILVNLGMVHRNGEWLPYWDGWIAFLRDAGWRRFGWYVWDQGSGLPGDWNGRLAPSHEFVFHFNREARRPHKVVETKLGGQRKTGKGLRKRDGTVGEWAHAGRLVQPTKILDSVIRVNRHSTFTEHVDHPAVFPVELATHVLATFSSAGALAYEPFAGSGTAIVAAEQLGRRCYAIEINPAYCDVIVSRWEHFTGGRAELVTDRAAGAD